jgi:gas vesicle protein
MDTQTITGFANLLVGGVVGVLLVMFKKYAEEKGKHLATKEDHAEVLKQMQDTTTSVQRIETEYSGAKAYRAAMGQQDFITQNFGLLQEQLKAQTEAVERIKTALQREVEIFKTDLQWQQQIAVARLGALRAFWALTETLQFHGDAELDIDRRKEIATRLTDWYYRDGNAMLVSFWLSAHVLLVRDMLLDGDTAGTIRRVLSGARTTLKEYIGVYSTEDVQTPIAELKAQIKAKYGAQPG